jgi:hypothetical protein
MPMKKSVLVKRFKEAHQNQLDEMIHNGIALAAELSAEGVDFAKIRTIVDVRDTDEWVSFSNSEYYMSYKALFPRNELKEHRYAREAFILFFNAFKDKETFEPSKFTHALDEKIKHQCNLEGNNNADLSNDKNRKNSRPCLIM